VKRSEIILHLAKRFPAPFRALLTLSLKGYLPISLYDHWISAILEKDLWPPTSWIGRTVHLVNGMHIEVDPRDYVGRSIMDNGCFETETVHFVQRFLKPGMVFLDIGANIGQYSLLASELVGSEGTVHSFEPYPLMYAVLRRNVERNHCVNVHCNCVALDEQEGSQQLFLSGSKGFGSTSFVPAEHYSGLQIGVRTMSVDRYAQVHGLDRVDLIKIDVEGAEMSVLKGAHFLLDKHPDVALVLEFNDTAAHRFGYSSAQLADYLRARGFKLFRLQESGISPYKNDDGKLIYYNVVASRTRKFLPLN
jgi:FkbM family methyltransferase